MNKGKKTVLSNHGLKITFEPGWDNRLKKDRFPRFEFGNDDGRVVGRLWTVPKVQKLKRMCELFIEQRRENGAISIEREKK